MWMNECSPEEQTILVAITSLASQLSRPLTAYADAFGELNRKYFRTRERVGSLPGLKAAGSHNPSRRSLVIARSTRAAERYGA